MSEKENKVKIAITVDADLLKAVDDIAGVRGESRSAVITRMMKNGIEDQRKLLKQMENPVYRAILSTMTASPDLLQKMSQLVCDEISIDEAKELKLKASKLTKDGQQRQKAKKNEREIK